MPNTTKRHLSPKKKVIGAVVAIVVGVAVAGIVWYAINDGIGQQVTITATNWQYTGCWQDTSSSGTMGYSEATTFVASDTLTSPSYATCTITGVSVSTDGFSVTNSNAPLTIEPGATQTLSVTVGVPSSGYTGAVTIVVQVTES